jgi:hypothetical protein
MSSSADPRIGYTGAKMTSTDRNAIPIDTSELPLFDGFPYLTTRIVPALYHITLLSADATETTLLELAQVQASANRLDTCLVLHARLAVFFSPEGGVARTETPPRGGALLSHRLALPVDPLQSRELTGRQLRLDRIVAEGQNKGGYILGDLSKGGHPATAAELEQLRGNGSERVPRGLERCTECDDWRGVCLDPSETFAEMVMTVYCRCANHNRCARCGVPLYDRRLNANFYDPHDRSIWHVPGFCGLDHRCSGQLGARVKTEHRRIGAHARGFRRTRIPPGGDDGRS